MEFRRIEYFLVLAERLNYSRAAEELHISQQALTRQIQLLEEEVGAPLLIRTTRRVELTLTGMFLQEQMRPVQEEFRRRSEAAIRYAGEQKNFLNIGFFSALPKRRLVEPVLKAIEREFPKLELSVQGGSMDQMKDWLVSRQIDLCLTNAHDFEDWRGFERVNLAVVPARIVVGVTHPWAEAGLQKVTPSQMREASVLFLRKDHPMEFNSTYAKLSCRRTRIARDFDSMLATLSLGHDFSIFPCMFNDMELGGFRYIELPDELAFNFRTMAACRTSCCKGTLRRVMNFLKETRGNFGE